MSNHQKDQVIQHTPFPRIAHTTSSSQFTPNPGRPMIPQPKISGNSQSAFVIPWHSLVPILTACAEPSASPPITELSPPLSAPPVPTTSMSKLDVHDEDPDTEMLPLTVEDDDDVFENETSEAGTSSESATNKRRTQSLSSLQSTSRDNSLGKVNIVIM